MLSRRPLSILMALLLFACAISFIVFSTLGALSFLNSATTGALGNSSFVQNLISGFSTSSAEVFLFFSLYGVMFWRLGAMVLLALMCIILAIVLLVRSGRKVNPMPTAIWGGGVMFVSLFVGVFCSLNSVFSLTPPGDSLGEYIALMNTGILGSAITAVISFIVGIFVCGFASALYSHAKRGLLADLPDPAPRVVPAAAPQAAPAALSAEESLKKLLELKESGLITPEEIGRAHV
jgi:hypothetical protein